MQTMVLPTLLNLNKDLFNQTGASSSTVSPATTSGRASIPPLPLIVSGIGTVSVAVFGHVTEFPAFIALDIFAFTVFDQMAGLSASMAFFHPFLGAVSGNMSDLLTVVAFLLFF